MKKISALLCAVVLMVTMTVPAFAAPTGDVSGVIEQTWQSAAQQIKTVVNSVVFPALDMILVILLFVKIGSAYICLLYTSPSPRDRQKSRMPSSA